MKTWQYLILIIFAFAGCALTTEIGKNETESEMVLSPVGAVKLVQREKSDENETESDVVLSPVGAVKLAQNAKFGNRIEKSRAKQEEGVTNLPSQKNETNSDEKPNIQQAKRGGHRSRASSNTKKRHKYVRTSMSKLKEDPSMDEMKNNELVTPGELLSKNVDEPTCTAYKSKKRKRSQMEIAISEIRQKNLRKRSVDEDEITEIPMQREKDETDGKEISRAEKSEFSSGREKQDENSTILEAPKKAKLTYRQFLEWRLSKLNRPQGINLANRTKDDVKVSAESADEQKVNEVGVKHKMEKEKDKAEDKAEAKAEKMEEENEERSAPEGNKQNLLANLVKASQRK